MKQKIGNRITYPQWADDRFKRLDQLDRLLDGSFYDHLPYAYCDETTTSGSYIPITDRRPSVQYNLPSMVARGLSRKLFAGRYAPVLNHDIPEVLLAVNRLIESAALVSRMQQVATFGSIGSAAVTFKFLAREGGGSDLVVKVWRAKYCRPTFDQTGELKQLRVQYVVPAVEFLEMDVATDWENKPLKDSLKYWFIRDFTTATELTYRPIAEMEWKPAEYRSAKLVENEDLRPAESHQLGFVPAQWFVNLTGSESHDGCSTWEPAVPNAIDLDYTLSQLGRGIRYNASPQLVIKGDLANMEEASGGVVVRGPTNYLQFASDRRDSEGNTLSGGGANLLEMTGGGIRTGLEYCDKTRMMALEQIAASRRDPNRMRAPSGKAAEALDQDVKDLVGELRTQYGDHGYLKFLKKMGRAAVVSQHPLFVNIDALEVDGLELEWPSLETMSAAELFPFVQGLALAVQTELTTIDHAQTIFSSAIDLSAESADLVEETGETDDQQGAEEGVADGEMPDDMPPPGGN